MEFPRGITALVGPNGSGKSNVVDAVRWCLGEQSVRDLRGQRAEDVIYAGARKVQGLAEVSLTFEAETDTRHGWCSEVCVSRRLYRSGDSEYLLNRQRARLKDVTGALREMGIDAGRHVVVTQGMADSLLSASPADRRTLLEQAAGLASYRERRDDARHKLTTTRQNIQTIEVVLAELEPRLKLLRRQARAVEERDVAAQKLQEYLGLWYAASWETASLQLNGLQNQAREAAVRRTAAVERLKKVEDEVQSALQRERHWYQKVEVAVAAVHQTERDRDAMAYEIDRLQQHIKTLDGAQADRERRARGQIRMRDEAAERMRAAETSLASIRAQLGASERDGKQSLDEVERLQAQVSILGNELAERRTRLAGAEDEYAGLQRDVSSAKLKVEELRQRCRRTREWLDQTASARAQLVSEAKKAAALLHQAEQRETELRASLSECAQEMDKQRKRLQRARRLRGRAQTRVQETSSILTVVEATCSALASQAGSRVLGELRIVAGWEGAAASALRDVLHAEERSRLLASDEREVGDDLKAWRRDLGTEMGHELQWADSVAESSDTLASLVLASTVLAVDGLEAQRLWEGLAHRPGHRIGSPPIQVVTRSGERLSWLGQEAVNPEDEAVRFLAARREADALNRRRGHESRRADALEQTSEHLTGEVAQKEQQVREREKVYAGAKRDRYDLQAEVERIEREGTRLQAEQEVLERQLIEQENALSSAQEHLELSGRKMEGMDASLQQLREAMDQVDGAATDMRNRLTLALDHADTYGRQMRRLAERERDQVDQLARLRADTERAAEEVEAFRHATREYERRRAELESAVSDTSRRGRELIEIYHDQKRELETLRSEKPAESQYAQNLRELQERVSLEVSRHERILAELEQAERLRGSLSQEIFQELGRHPDDLPTSIGHGDPPTEAEIKRLRVRAAQYAEADVTVVHEYQELEERRQRLLRQVGDLVQAADDLQEIMDHADREMYSRFQGAFATVSEEFSRVFRIMFGGGEAQLVQLEGEGGVDIHARLPGKRNRSSVALSGGERALVASSLLFGVIKTRPAPFCILDEVDAALDESNVDRYLEVLRDVSRKTQIVVVTHNRGTMAAADVLYGLTMDDDGASNVLSLRLDTYGAAV